MPNQTHFTDETTKIVLPPGASLRLVTSGPYVGSLAILEEVECLLVTPNGREAEHSLVGEIAFASAQFVAAAMQQSGASPDEVRRVHERMAWRQKKHANAVAETDLQQRKRNGVAAQN